MWTGFSIVVSLWLLANPLLVDWDFKHSRILRCHPWSVRSVAFAPDGTTLASGGLDGSLTVWDIVAGRELLQLTASYTDPNKAVIGLVYGSDSNTLIAARLIGSVEIWDLRSGIRRSTIRTHAGCAWAVALAEDGKTLVTGAIDGSLSWWDIPTSEEKQRINAHIDPVRCISISSNQKVVASGSNDGTVKLWDFATGRNIATLDGHTSRVVSLGFAPNGRTLVSASDDGTIRLWEVITGKQRATVSTHSRGPVVSSIGLHTWILLGGDNRIRIWDLLSEREAFALHELKESISAAGIDLSGTTVALGTSDGKILLFKICRHRDRRQGLQVTEIARTELESCWVDLHSEDASKAQLAMSKMLHCPARTLDLLAMKLHPSASVDNERVRGFIAQLDSDRFVIRERATAALKEIADVVEPLLRSALEDELSLEARRRIEHILASASEGVPTTTRLAPLRAVEVLEDIGTREAVELLRQLAAGVRHARLTQESRASLHRIMKNTTRRP